MSRLLPFLLVLLAAGASAPETDELEFKNLQRRYWSGRAVSLSFKESIISASIDLKWEISRNRRVLQKGQAEPAILHREFEGGMTALFDALDSFELRTPEKKPCWVGGVQKF